MPSSKNDQAGHYNQTTFSCWRHYMAKHQHNRDLFVQPLTYKYNAQVHCKSGTTGFPCSFHISCPVQTYWLHWKPWRLMSSSEHCLERCRIEFYLKYANSSTAPTSRWKPLKSAICSNRTREGSNWRPFRLIHSITLTAKCYPHMQHRKCGGSILHITSTRLWTLSHHIHDIAYCTHWPRGNSEKNIYGWCDVSAD